MNKIYLAGPMRGIPQFNFPAFHAAAARLRAAGFEVFSPAEIGEAQLPSCQECNDEEAALQQGYTTREAMEKELIWICREADAVALLPGWQTSRGAMAEAAAAYAIGLPAFEFPTEE